MFLLGSIVLFGQPNQSSKIYGFYWDAGNSRYFIINEKNIFQLNFCNKLRNPHCDFSISIDSAQYHFVNDTLIFNFGLFESDDYYYENRWIFIDTLNRFLDIESGEYIKIKKELLDKKLATFGLKLLDLEKPEEY